MVSAMAGAAAQASLPPQSMTEYRDEGVAGDWPWLAELELREWHSGWPARRVQSDSGRW